MMSNKNVRRFQHFASTAVVAVAFAAVPCWTAAAANNPPNVLFIVIDDSYKYPIISS